jgi:hypothetical protein
MHNEAQRQKQDTADAAASYASLLRGLMTPTFKQQTLIDSMMIDTHEDKIDFSHLPH